MSIMSARLAKMLCAALLSLSLSACDVSVPSQLETGQMRLSEETRALAVSTLTATRCGCARPGCAGPGERSWGTGEKIDVGP